MKTSKAALAFISSITLSVIAAQHALAQTSALQRRLESATRLKCTFSVLATGTWEAAKPSAAVSASMLEIGFSGIDIDEGTAEAETEFGVGFISVRYAQGYLHLMQVSDAGPLYVTTVLAQAAGEGRLMAVHTRLEYSRTIIPGFTSRPEMYVGSCTIEN